MGLRQVCDECQKATYCSNWWDPCSHCGADLNHQRFQHQWDEEVRTGTGTAGALMAAYRWLRKREGEDHIVRSDN